jgi:hypothetical protein
MKTRQIPPLPPLKNINNKDDAATTQDSKLVQVTAIIRHGARTPWGGDHACWDGYWTNPETGVWDCELTTMTSPPPPPVVEEEEEGQPEQASAGADAMFLFEKRYDALQNPPRLSNELNGTCQRGQLLLRGYDQELANGQHLRNAYAFYGQQGDDQGAAADKRMRLFDLTDMNPKDGLPYAEPNLRFRADDDQRTLMSGQVLLRGLFGEEFAKHSETLGEDPIIPLHTADRSRDVLGLEQRMCPRLNEIAIQAEQSTEFKALNNSREAITIRNMMERELGGDFLDAAIDCLMTVMCTDRPLPDILNDYNGTSVPSSQGESRASSSSSDSSDDGNHNYGENLFDRVSALVSFVHMTTC